MKKAASSKRKSEEDIKREKEIINNIKKKYKELSGHYNSKIMFSDYTDISIESKTLRIHIANKEINIKKTEIKYPVSVNMQTDGAAFEGWAICLKAWLSEEVEKVHLTWDIPSTVNDHYNRFLYRVLRFGEMFDWFSFDDKDNCVSQFKTRFINTKNNSSNKVPNRKNKECEEQVEFDLVNKNQNAFISHFGIKKLYQHLPIGVKTDKNSNLFSGRNSAIDLWGIIDNRTLNIFELKYIKAHSKSKNIKVGIISELLLYINIMNDIRLGIINTPNAKLSHEKELYRIIRLIENIKGIFLTNDKHPLLASPYVKSLLNCNNKNLLFDFVNYSWDNSVKKIIFN
ncbi:MAG: hypothetical protein QMB39_03240 [Bacteroidales bacterium]